MGETDAEFVIIAGVSKAFSILERIDVGETVGAASSAAIAFTFSILERIDVGETM